MNGEKKKDGISVKEMEGYAKQHRFEIFFCALFLLASLFTLIFWGPILSIFLIAIGAITAIFIPNKVENLARKMAIKVFHKPATTQLMVGIGALILAIFLAPIVFLWAGLHAGRAIIQMAKEAEHIE